MISTIAASVAFVLITPFGAGAQPVHRPVGPPTPGPPKIGAPEWAVYDDTNDVMLATWNVNERRPMASVTKIMTAMVVLDNAELDDTVVVPESAVSQLGSSAGLVAGERWSVYDLLVAMLVRSGNDAAWSLAHHVAHGSIDGFVAKMNAKAAELGMVDTHYENPNGLDAEGHYTTANDLITMMRAALDYPVIGEIARISTIELPADADGEVREVHNTNRLLGAYPGVVGLKTGDTPYAKKVLLGVTERGPRRILTVVMGSDDHFRDSRELIEWAFETYGIYDRWLRPFFSEQGGGAVVGEPVELTEPQKRRLAVMPSLNDGRWRMTPISELPKAALITDWLKSALPGVAGGNP